MDEIKLFDAECFECGTPFLKEESGHVDRCPDCSDRQYQRAYLNAEYYLSQKKDAPTSHNRQAPLLGLE